MSPDSRRECHNDAATRVGGLELSCYGARMSRWLMVSVFGGVVAVAGGVVVRWQFTVGMSGVVAGLAWVGAGLVGWRGERLQ